jgi:hypothetical protein
MTAFNILRNVMYRELKRLPDLAAGKPEKMADYLPKNVEYDAKRCALIHTYSGGSQATTDLRTLQLVDIDLLDEQYRRMLTNDERKAAENEFY